jgi:hypothetical protein
MDGAFRFQLGVFKGAFVPTAGNLAQWAEHWVAARHTAYSGGNALYADSFPVLSNDPPFIPGKPAYVWGFRGDASSAEWILFRAASWTWPLATTLPPIEPTVWRARDAVAVVGQVNATGEPFLMRTAAVSGVRPPDTSWDQWVSVELAASPSDGPDDDPDRDGSPNLLEYVFGTLPTVFNPPVSTPVALDAGRLVMTVPRRIDRPAILTFEVSGDLSGWDSGPAFTEVLEDGLERLVVGDLAAVGVDDPRRFMRLRAALPE